MKRSTSWIAVLPSLVIPFCLGMTMFLGMSYLISQEYIANELLLRYLTGHPISQVTVAMFFVGLASLAMIGKNVADQFLSERRISLRSDSEQDHDKGADNDEIKVSESGSPLQADSKIAKDVDDQSAWLNSMPERLHEHYLWQRLSAALAHLKRIDSTSQVEEELKYLSELDLERQQQRYSLVRILIWATPMLGFLGTVLGISEALGGINVGPDNDFQDMMNGLRGSLYVAFDTTALALTLSMVLMFVQFLVDRFESQLLSLVDQRARGEVASHFDLTVVNEEMKRFVDEYSEVTQKSVDRQVEIWLKTIGAAEKAWSTTLTQTNDLVQGNLSEALDENVANLAHYLGEAIAKADDSMTRRLQQWQVTLSSNARLMEEQQKRLAEQAAQIEAMVKHNVGAQKLEEVVEKNRAASESAELIRATLATLNESIVSLRDSNLAVVKDVVARGVDPELNESTDKPVEFEPPSRQQELHVAAYQAVEAKVVASKKMASDSEVVFVKVSPPSGKPAVVQDQPAAVILRMPDVSIGNTDSTRNPEGGEQAADTPDVILAFENHSAKSGGIDLKMASQRASSFLVQRREKRVA